jgi:hypothetical protein
MLLEPDERMHLEAVGGRPNSTVLVAEHGRQLVGYVEAARGASSVAIARPRTS